MTTPTSDASLVAGHLAGDPDALAGIYDRYADSLHDTAAAMLNDRNEAADVLQDVMLIAAERLEQLRDPTRLKPWLFAILRNEVYRRTKKRRRTIVTDFSGSDDGTDMADPRLDDPGDEAADDVSGDELAELVRNAARGLDERDQLVLELSVRQGLGGQDLADALGVSTNQSYTLVHRMRERVEKSLGAYAVARAGRRDCVDLDRMLAKWDGEFSVLIRKRVARHIESCDTCDRRRRTAVPFAMFAAAPVYAAPAELRDRILAGARTAPSTPYRFVADGGFPTAVRSAARVAAWVAPTAAAVLLLVVGGAVVTFAGDDTPDGIASVDQVRTTTTATTTTSPSATATTPPETATTDGQVTTSTSEPRPVPPTRVPGAVSPDAPAATTVTKEPPPTAASTTAPPVVAPPAPPAPTTPPVVPPAPPAPTLPPAATTTMPPIPGSVTASGGSIALGSGAANGSITLSNPGDEPVDFTVTGSLGSFSVSPSSGTLAGGTSTQLVASIDRTGLPEGDIAPASLQVTGGGSSLPITVSASVERPPVISDPGASGACVITNDPDTNTVVIGTDAVITDESSVSATMSTTGPAGQNGTDQMGPDGPTWFGAVNLTYPPNDPGAVQGTWSWTITATDARGNSSSTSGSVNVSGC